MDTKGAIRALHANYLVLALDMKCPIVLVITDYLVGTLIQL